MKDWWLNLSFREKQTVGFGTLALIIFLIYSLIWAPLNNKVSTMRSQIEQNQKLLAWMKSTDEQIQTITKNFQKSATTHSTASILSVVQNQINQSQIASNLTQLRQAETDSVQLSFTVVNFDKLFTWLTEIWQEQGYIITQITATPSGSPGMVKAEVVLKTAP